MSELNAWRINAILAGSPTQGSDVMALENYIGEAMCDSNNWRDNPFTMIGFAWAHPKYHGMASRLQEELDKKNAQKMNPMVYLDGVMYEYFGDEQTEESYELYCQFIADVVNSLPTYRERWFTELKEQLEHMGK